MTTLIKNTDYKIINQLQEEIQAFQVNLSEPLYRTISTIVTPYIYFYPKYNFRQYDEDVLSEFYLCILNRLKDILLTYRTNEVLFSTYFSVVLKNQYLNFIKKKQNQETKITHSYSENIDLFPSKGYPISLEKQDSSTHALENFSEEVEEIFTALIKKNPTNYLILKLYYIELFDTDDLAILQKITNMRFAECLQKIDNIKNEVLERTNRKNAFEYRSYFNYLKIVELQKKMHKHQNSTTPQEWMEKEKMLRENQSKVIARYYKTRTHPSFKCIADILNLPEIEVANFINYFKKKYQKNDMAR